MRRGLWVNSRTCSQTAQVESSCVNLAAPLWTSVFWPITRDDNDDTWLIGSLWGLNVGKMLSTMLGPQPMKTDGTCHHHRNHHHLYHHHHHHHHFNHPQKVIRVAIGSEFGPQPCLTFPNFPRAHPIPWVLLLPVCHLNTCMAWMNGCSTALSWCRLPITATTQGCGAPYSF